MTDEVVYLSALEEEEHTIAQANAPARREESASRPTWSPSRIGGEFTMVRPEAGRVHGRVAEPARSRSRRR